jgi:hypothetical protein
LILSKYKELIQQQVPVLWYLLFLMTRYVDQRDGFASKRYPLRVSAITVQLLVGNMPDAVYHLVEHTSFYYNAYSLCHTYMER